MSHLSAASNIMVLLKKKTWNDAIEKATDKVTLSEGQLVKRLFIKIGNSITSSQRAVQR